MNTPIRDKVLLCIDNIAGLESLRYLAQRPSVEVVAVIVHPEANAVQLDEILALCERQAIPAINVLDARARFNELIVPLAPDFIVSIYFDYILDDRFLALAAKDSINLHPGYLPYNKGFYYYAWAVLDGTPAGVSIHRIETAVDAGPIISQMRVRVEGTDTGDIIYDKHMDASIELFRTTWPSIETGTYRLFRQRHGGTRKKITETTAAMEINPDATYVARELIDLLRTFSFRGEGGCLMQIDGKKYSIGIEFSELVDNVNQVRGKRDNYLVG
ncbi:formyltransferase family protein [Burkholderia gladioli]